jgi:hypothetical protein
MEYVHQQAEVPLRMAELRPHLHLLQQKHRHLRPRAKTDRPESEVLDISIGVNALDDGVLVPLEHLVLLQVAADPGLLMNYLFLAVGHEVRRRFKSFPRGKVEGPEHAELGGPDEVHLQVLELGRQGEFALPDDSQLSVPQEGVVDHASLHVDRVLLVLGRCAKQQQNVGLELPQFDDGRLHFCQEVLLVQKRHAHLYALVFLNEGVCVAALNQFQDSHPENVLVPGLVPDILRVRVDLAHQKGRSPNLVVSCELAGILRRVLFFKVAHIKWVLVVGHRYSLVLVVPVFLNADQVSVAEIVQAHLTADVDHEEVPESFDCLPLQVELIDQSFFYSQHQSHPVSGHHERINEVLEIVVVD